MLDKFRRLVDKLSGKKPALPPVPEAEAEETCCAGQVHIAYRGLSDDKQYVAYSRAWNEVKFFRQNNLKVFCADCRRRLL